MALFGSKKKTEEQQATPAAAAATPLAARDLTHVLKHARITEKATMVQGMSAYVFDVAENATKRDIMQAVKALYKITPRRVTVVTVPTKTKRNMRTGRTGVKRGGKKAYVYLKQGETISIA